VGVVGAERGTKNFRCLFSLLCNLSIMQVERVLNAQGSCTGAGSGEFHTYRHARRREFTRLEEIEKQQLEETKQREFLLKVAQKKIETELRTQKNVEKRRRQKEKKLNRKRKYLESHPEAAERQKHGRKSEEGSESEEESESGEEGEGKAEEGAQGKAEETAEKKEHTGEEESEGKPSAARLDTVPAEEVAAPASNIVNAGP
jgi:hypothetical protein